MAQNFEIVVIDIGRGRVKGKVVGTDQHVIFPSVHAYGYSVDLNSKNDRIHLEIVGLDTEVNGEWFAGEFALESQDPFEYSTDSKTDQTAQVLFASALNQLSVKTGDVKIVLGVPKSMYTQDVLDEVKACYLDRKITIINKVTDQAKVITVTDITIFPEGNAAALYQVSLEPELEECWFAIANFGFKTLEWSVFAPGIEYQEGSSRSIPFGNMNILSQVQNELKSNLSHHQIDTDESKRIKQAKKKAYVRNTSNVESKIKSVWRTDREDMRFFCCGGTAQNLTLNYEYTPNGQLATLLGLEIVAKDLYA